jgi:hypothetical protein
MRATLRVEVRSTSGILLDWREAHNAVLQSGARLMANLFAGQGTPITHMMVGTNDAPESDSFSTIGLANEVVNGEPALAAPVDAAIPPEAFSEPELDETRRLIRIRVRGTLPAAAAIGTVREAALVSRAGETTTLYNRVTFAPIQKGNDHELTLFWEITFPYGDLQWLP